MVHISTLRRVNNCLYATRCMNIFDSLVIVSYQSYPTIASASTSTDNSIFGNKMAKLSMDEFQEQAPSTYFKLKTIRRTKITPNFPNSAPLPTFGQLDGDKNCINKASWHLSPFDGCTLDQCNTYCNNGSCSYDNNTCNCQYESYDAHGNIKKFDDCLDCLYLESLEARKQLEIQKASAPNVQNNIAECCFNSDKQTSNKIERDAEDELPFIPYMELGSRTGCYVTPTRVDEKSDQSSNKSNEMSSNTIITHPPTEVNATNQKTDTGSKSFASIESYDEKTKFIKHVFAHASPISSFENDYSKFNGGRRHSDFVEFVITAPSTDTSKNNEKISHLDRAVQLQNEEMQLRSQVTDSLTKVLLDMPLNEYIKVIKSVLDEMTTTSPT